PDKNKTLDETRRSLQILAQTVPTGSDELFFLPYLLGDRSPIYHAAARGVFFGLKITHKQAHLVRASMEGVLFALYSIAKVLEENNLPIKTIYAGGGFAQSGFWVKMLADVFNTKVVLNESIENSAFGAVIVGWKAIGIINSLQEADKLIQPSMILEPDLEKHKIYHQNFAVFERLYQKLKDEF
ncbi:MAG: gluconate kinase, partial [Verrucomicrobia bacterium]|nr:gluconate kinase [Cytophagales bacterium]